MPDEIGASRAMVWLRRDLRLHDHRALAAACASGAQVFVAFVFDTTILGKLDNPDDLRLTFIHDSLAEVDAALRVRGARLLVAHGDPVEEIPRLAKAIGATSVWTNKDYEPSAVARDNAVAAKLKAAGVAFTALKDQVVFEEREVLTRTGGVYKVFTPYRAAWLSALGAVAGSGTASDAVRACDPDLDALAACGAEAVRGKTLDDWPLERLGFRRRELWIAPGMRGAKQLLARFRPKVADYETARDRPAPAAEEPDGTSGLSAHLRFGTLSIRECVRLALATRGADTWLSELVWREFYQMILSQTPELAAGRPYKPETAGIRWPGTDEHFAAWCEGRTGYPIVDAAMRHFNRTGWMHNRLRMIVAMFLVKDLLVDWRKGEAYFARHLLDFDFAANNGGWQWSASTGCDAQPYFRIFNPIGQSERYDPDGRYLRSELPELAACADREIHFPHAKGRNPRAAAYPLPLVDHGLQRMKAMGLFQAR